MKKFTTTLVLLSSLTLTPAVYPYTQSRSEHESALAKLKAKLKTAPKDSEILSEIGERLTLWMADHDGEREEVPLAEFYLDRARTANPKNSLPLAWMGILTMVQAKSASVFNKKDLAQKGLKYLDQAVAMDSRNVKVRMLRGSVGVKVPKSFGRAEQALSDLEYVKSKIKTDEAAAEKLRISLCVLYLNLGKAYDLVGDPKRAREALEVAVKHDRGRKENQEASELLARADGAGDGGWEKFVKWSGGR